MVLHFLFMMCATLLLFSSPQAQLLAVLDKSQPEDAALSRGKLDMLAQVVRGEMKRRLPASFQVMSEGNTVTILKDMGVDRAAWDGECEVDIARKLQADWLMSTKLVRIGTRWSQQLSQFRSRSGEVLDRARIAANQEEEKVGRVERATGLLSEKLAIQP